MSDLVTRLRALADTPHPTPQTQRALREAADALEAEETRRMMLNTSNGEWSKRFHAARAEAADFRELLKEMRDLADKDGYLSRILSVKVIDQALSQPGPGAQLMERVKKLEAVAEAARVMMDASRPPGEETAKSDMRAVAEALAALEEEK